MRRAMLLASTALLVASVTPAAADRAAPLVEVGARALAPVGPLGAEFSGGWETAMQLGASVGRVGLTVPFEVGGLDSYHPARDGETLTTLALGGELRATLHQGAHGGLYGRAGYRWRWMFSSTPVTRRCDEVGGCDGGFWTETPGYWMSGPIVALGATWSWATPERVRFGAALEARLEGARVDLPGAGEVSGGLASLALQLWVGGDARP